MNGRKPGGLSFRAPPPRPLPVRNCTALAVALSLALWTLAVVAALHLAAVVWP